MRELKPSTRDKYTKLIQDCYNRKYFDKNDMRKLYNADTNIWTAMHRMKMIKKTNGLATGMCQWIGPAYSDLVLNQIMREYMVIGTMKNLNQMKKRRQAQLLSNDTPQLTIQPIKRVERTHPVPVQQEPIHDTSNSKMFIILAVGTLIGFLIATLIWK
jgi:hypothetical protein